MSNGMSQDAEMAANEHSSSMMEDFGRFSPVETLDSDPDFTDENFDEAYGEENAGA
jgi:hypothetical protein